MLVVCMKKLTGKVELMVRYNNCYDYQSSQKNRTQSYTRKKKNQRQSQQENEDNKYSSALKSERSAAEVHRFASGVLHDMNKCFLYGQQGNLKEDKYFFHTLSIPDSW